MKAWPQIRRMVYLLWAVPLLLTNSAITGCFLTFSSAPDPPPIVVVPDDAASDGGSDGGGSDGGTNDGGGDSGGDSGSGDGSVQPPIPCTETCASELPCMTGACVQGQCVWQPVADGTSCDDAAACTQGDICTDGACVGQPRYGAGKKTFGLQLAAEDLTDDACSGGSGSSLTGFFGWGAGTSVGFAVDGDVPVAVTGWMTTIRLPVDGAAEVVAHLATRKLQFPTATAGDQGLLYTGVYGNESTGCPMRTIVRFVPHMGAPVAWELEAGGGIAVTAVSTTATGFVLAGVRRTAVDAPHRLVVLQVGADGTLLATIDGPEVAAERGPVFAVHDRSDGALVLSQAVAVEVLESSGARRWALEGLSLPLVLPMKAGPIVMQLAQEASGLHVDRCRFAALTGQKIDCDLDTDVVLVAARRLPNAEMVAVGALQPITSAAGNFGSAGLVGAAREVLRLDAAGNERWRAATPGGSTPSHFAVDSLGRATLLFALAYESSDTSMSVPLQWQRLDASGNATCATACSQQETDACSDGNVCTKDQCVAGQCSHPSSSGACDDGDGCHKLGACAAGSCSGADAIACPSGGACTLAACSPGAGCTSTPAPTGAACDDGDICTANDVCTPLGACKGALIACDDGEVCTADSCAGPDGCSHQPTTEASCDDGDLCTGGDACVDGNCKGAAIDCSDDNPCTADLCAATDGCVHLSAAGTPCDDGDACTTADTCSLANACTGTALNCDDDNVCTADVCSATLGCVHKPASGQSCDDGNACTKADTCATGNCQGLVISCDDGDGCTTDGCAKATGCHHSPATGVACNDADSCTKADVCTNGNCQGAAINCDDSDACTSDACAAGSCSHTPLFGGACGTPPCSTNADCDDGNPCLADVCVLPGGTCTHTMTSGPCQEQGGCATGSCVFGTCLMTPATSRSAALIEQAGVQEANGVVSLLLSTVIVGRANTAAGPQGLIVSVVAATGKVESQTAIGTAGGSTLSAVIARSSGALAVGQDSPAGGLSQGWLVELNGNGVATAQHLIGGPDSELLRAIAPRGTGYVTVGDINAKDGGQPHGWVAFLDKQLQLVSTKTHASVGTDRFDAVEVDSNGVIVVCAALDRAFCRRRLDRLATHL